MRAVVEVSKLDGSIVGRYRMCTDCDRAHGWRIGKALAQATKRQNPCGTTLLRFADEYEGRIEWPKGAQNVPSVLIDTWTRKCRWFPSMNDASRFLGHPPDRMRNQMKRGRPFKQRWVAVVMRDTATWPELREKLESAGWEVSEPALRRPDESA